jgi:hypothetical protein
MFELGPLDESIRLGIFPYPPSVILPAHEGLETRSWEVCETAKTDLAFSLNHSFPDRILLRVISLTRKTATFGCQVTTEGLPLFGSMISLL